MLYFARPPSAATCAARARSSRRSARSASRSARSSRSACLCASRSRSSRRRVSRPSRGRSRRSHSRECCDSLESVDVRVGEPRRTGRDACCLRSAPGGVELPSDVGRCRGSAGRDPRGEVDSNEEECEEDRRDEDGLDVDRDFFFRLRSSDVIRTISRSKLSKASRVSASANALATLVCPFLRELSQIARGRPSVNPP